MRFSDFYHNIFSKQNPTELELFNDDIELYKEEYGITSDLYFESPVFTGNYGGSMNEQGLNKSRAKTVRHTVPFLGEYDYDGNKLEMFYEKDLDKVSVILLWKDMTAAYAYFKEIENGVEIDSAWNHLDFHGLYTHLFWKWILPKYEFIQSSYSNTKQSAKFWTNISKTAIKNNHRFTVYDMTNNTETDITDPKYLEDNFSKIWNNASDHLRLRVYRN